MFTIHDYQGNDGHPLRYGKLVNPQCPDTGKPMLFVPGLGGSVKGALDFLECLLPEYSPIYGPDLRGFGLNPVDEPVHHLNTIMDDLEAFHRQVIAPAGHESLTLCGISLGGIIANTLAVRYPERYDKLILLAPAYKPHARSFSLGYTVRNILAFLFLGKRARTMLPYDITAITQNEAILNDPQYTEFPPLVLTPGFLLSVRGLSLKAFAQAGQLTLPTLMVIPGQDIVCDPAAMRQAYDRIPDSTPKRLLDYPDFYHDVLFETECPQIAQELLAWSGSLNSRSASSLSR